MSDAEEIEEEAVNEEAPKNETRRIFINHVDSYHGKNISKYLAKCVVGASNVASLEKTERAEEEKNESYGGKKENTYKIYGTVRNEKDYKKPDHINEVIKNDNKDHLLEQLMECDIIIYDIVHDTDQLNEACWAVTSLHSEIERIDKPKVFILVSTVMTWAKCKPADPDDTEVPFTEEDFRRRKPHPNFKEHLSAEKTVLKFGKTNKKKLNTYVVCGGLVYGQEEQIFHYFFKLGWHNTPELPVFGSGKNVVPTIHVNDLAAVLQNIADQKPKVRYLVAVDDSKLTLKQIVKGISKQLSTGKVKSIPKEDAFLIKEINQTDFDMLMIDLRLEAAFIRESMQIKWHSETGFIDNVGKIIKEYKITRNLIPFKICLLGPPGVGKTTIAQQLAKEYKVHHIMIKDVISKALQDLEKIAARADDEANRGTGAGADDQQQKDAEEEEEIDDEARANDVQDLEMIKESMESNQGRLDPQFVIRFYKERLLSKPCQNQGFILDGFPKTEEHAKELFAPDDQDEEEGDLLLEEQAQEPRYNKLITPDVIIKLDANDDFLCKRIMNLPEKLVQDTHNTEEGLTRRLAEYRALNNEEETVTNVFEEDFDLEVIKLAPELIEDDKSYLHKNIVDLIKVNYMKEPRNYGLTADEREQMKKVEIEDRLKKEREEKEERERREAEEAIERVRKQTEWQDKLEQIKHEELEYLETQSVPLRNYLMSHVMPTLTKGLIECAKIKPDDPIDYLAEFLFKNNPQIN